jgi:amino acid transporter
MSEASPTPSVGARRTGENSGTQSLSGHIGVVELIFSVLAFAAPMLVVASFMAIVISVGGVGAPLVFGVTTLVLLLFCVGYVKMTNYLPNPGAFYAYITAGLGKRAGLGASSLAVFGYSLFALGSGSFFGVLTNNFVVETLGGPELPWWIYSIACFVVTGTLGYLEIGLSVKLLSAVLALEVVMVTIFNIAVTKDGGPEGRSLAPLDPGSLDISGLGLAVVFASVCFLGFEATAVFREETKNPERTVPRAAYLSVLLIGGFYIFSAWAMITAYGTENILGAIDADFAAVFPDAMATYVGAWGRDVVLALAVGSCFACMLAVQNILSRYCFHLGADRILPAKLGRVHPRHGSPYVSSVVVAASIITMFAVFAVTSADPGIMYALLSGTGGVVIMLLMFLTSLAVVVFFVRRRGEITSPKDQWTARIAPGISAAGIGIVIYLSLKHFDVVTGGSDVVATALQVLIFAVFAAGWLYATWLRSNRPDVFVTIGRNKPPA